MENKQVKNENIKSGQLYESNIENCPVFIPEKLSLFKFEFSLQKLKRIKGSFLYFESQFELYFYKFLSGGKSLTNDFVDVIVQDLYLWKSANVARSVYVKEVVNAAIKYEKVVNILIRNKKLTKSVLLKQNKLLRPRGKLFGIRETPMRAGDPKTNKYAFYCAPHECINELFVDLIQYIESDNSSVLNKSLIGMIQFIFIHPYKDGNGRTSRALFLSQMQPKYGLSSSSLFLIYLKNINPEEYYAAMHGFRNSNFEKLKLFYMQAIVWVNQSLDELQDLFDGYVSKIGKNKFKVEYSQIVIKVDLNQRVDESVFQFHSKKAGKNIYINTALLNVLNQFDYYLRYELRKHQSN